MATPQKRFRIPDEVVRLVRSLHPDIKRKVRAALDRLAQDVEAGKVLGVGTGTTVNFLIDEIATRRIPIAGAAK